MRYQNEQVNRIFAMQFISGMSRKAIAAELGMNYSTLNVKFARHYNQIASLLYNKVPVKEIAVRRKVSLETVKLLKESMRIK